MKLKILGISLILVIIAAINSGSIGLFGLDLIASILGFSPLLVRVVYILIGTAGAYLALVTKGILGCLTSFRRS